jgi:nucleoside-diphosphate-sugar epimerase
MKIVITGGNGYIGARLSLYLANDGNQVIPLCFPSVPKKGDWTDKMSAVLEGDLRQYDTIARIADLQPDALIHLVSLDHFESEKEPGLVNETNVLPTWRLLDACTKTGLKKFIYFSTIHVYGKLPNSIIDETHPVNTVDSYGLTHYLSERICDHYNRKTASNVISVRLSNSYGDPVFYNNNCWWLAINDLCKSAFLKKEIRLHSDGTPQRDFLHGNDVCKAVIRLLHSDVKNIENNIYHVSSGKTVTILELARTVRDVYENRYGQLLPVLIPDKTITDFDTPVNVARFQISNEKIKNLGFSPDHNINTGINELFNYLENNDDGIQQ